jgi:hypothetical protein
MFLNNKYTSCYISLIANAQSRELPPDTYTERHHIIPKCMGGPDTSNNLVRLTAKEHFIAHRLLVQMTEGELHRKMVFALWRMTQDNKARNSRHKVTSFQYQNLKQLMAVNMSEQTREHNQVNGKPEHLVAWVKENGPWNKGKKMPNEFGQNISRKRKGSKSSETTCKNISAGIARWHAARKGSDRSLKGRRIPRFTTIIRHKTTHEEFITIHQTEWLKERGLARHVLERGTCEYEVVRRFVTRTGEEVPLKRK